MKLNSALPLLLVAVMAAPVVEAAAHASTMSGVSGAASSYYTYFERGGFGPSRWAFLDNLEDNQCGGTGGESGYGQSPVVVGDWIPGRCDSGMEDYNFVVPSCTYDDLEFSISNTGVKVGPKKDAMCNFGSMTVAHNPNTFSAQELVIHTGSEHKIMGQGNNPEEGSFPAELQVLHMEETNGTATYAMFGSMIDIDEDNDVEPNEQFEWLLQGWEAVAQKVADSCPPSMVMDSSEDAMMEQDDVVFKPVQKAMECAPIGSKVFMPPAFPLNESIGSFYDMPSQSDYGVFTYKGSLTTPSCTEDVHWNLADAPIVVSQDQLDRLYSLILCFVTKNHHEVSNGNMTTTEVKSCSFGTVADEKGATSRPTQPLNGRYVLHRCAEKPISQVMFTPVLLDKGETLASEATFMKPPPRMEPSNTDDSERQCDKALYTDCSDDIRYDPAVSPNLKSTQPAWNNAEGYWYGSLTAYGYNGLPLFEKFATGNNNNVHSNLPYQRENVMVFVNRTIQETRYYEHVTYMYYPATEEFCTLPVPVGASNVIGRGTCGINGHVETGGKFGVATFEKDGQVKIIYSNGQYDGAEGSARIIDDNTFYTTVGSEETGFSTSETTSYSNDDLTRIAVSGQYFIISDVPPYSTNPLAESYTYILEQTDMATWTEEYEKQLKEISVHRDDRQALVSIMSDMPSNETYAMYDPLLAENPYVEETGLKTEYIILIVAAVFVVLAIAAYMVHKSLINQQKLRYQEQFARRVAETIRFNGGHEDITPEALQEEFMRMDEDGNGHLDKKEMRDFMGSKMDEDDFEAMFHAIDTDGNGTIEFAEFCSFLSNMTRAFDRANATAKKTTPEAPKAPAPAPAPAAAAAPSATPSVATTTSSAPAPAEPEKKYSPTTLLSGEMSEILTYSEVEASEKMANDSFDASEAQA